MFFCTLTANATSFLQREWTSLTAGPCAVGQIQNDDDNRDQGETGSAHHSRLRDMTRSLGLHSRDGSNRHDYDDDAKPGQPCHAGSIYGLTGRALYRKGTIASARAAAAGR